MSRPGLLPPLPNLPEEHIVAYVRSTGFQDGDPRTIRSRLLASISDALGLVRPGRRDVIVVLPDHVEDVDTPTYLSAAKDGTVIRGVGDPAASNAPQLRWSTNSSVLRVEGDNVTIENMKLDLAFVDGANGFGIGGSNFALRDNYIIASTATNNTDIVLDTFSNTSGSLVIDGNEVVGAGSNPVLAAFRFDSSSLTRLKVTNNTMIGGAPTTAGWIEVSAAITGVDISDNVLRNSTTGSTACISVSAAASSGILARNSMSCTSGGTSNAEGIIFTGTTSTIGCVENYNTSDPRLSGVLSPAAAT